MKDRMTWLKSIAIIMVLGIALAGCAAMEKSEATDTEQLLGSRGVHYEAGRYPRETRTFKNPDPAEGCSP